MQFHEIPVGQRFDVIEGVRPVGMTTHLHALPRGKFAVDLLGDFGNFDLQLLNRGGHVQVILVLNVLRLLKLLAQGLDGLFEIEVIHQPKDAETFAALDAVFHGIPARNQGDYPQGCPKSRQRRLIRREIPGECSGLWWSV